MRLLFLVTFNVVFFLHTNFALGQTPRSITCNKKLTQCSINAPELVFGDHIAIVDERNMWVATGSVDEIERGTSRKVVIIKSYAPVKKNFKFMLISAKEANDPPEVKITRPLTFKQMGGSLGILAIGVGDNGAGFELTGFYQDVRNNFPILGRVNLISVAGDVTEKENIYTFYVNGIGVMGGTSLYIWMTSKLALRTEIALGFLYAMVKSTGGFKGNESAASHFNDGVGFQLRGTFGVFYDLGGWQAMLEAAPQVTHSTSGFSVSLGASSILR
jgi:hypothetical protein